MFDSPKIALGITAVAYLLLIVVILNRHDWDPSYFVNLGDRVGDPNKIPPYISTLRNSDGYDGQYYYRLALDPFTHTPLDFGITLHQPAYRQQRILYPLIVWAVSGGRPQLIPLAMIVVNYLALCALAWSGARCAQSLERHALWGLAFPGYAGCVLTLAKDLAEILTALLLLQTVWLIRRGRHWLAALFLTLAVLSRETALLVAVGVLGDALIERVTGRRPRAHVWPVVVVPLLVWALWQWILLARWGALPSVSGYGNIGLPFVGFFGLLRSVSALQNSTDYLWLFELCFLAAFTVSVLYAMRSTAAPRYEIISWLLYATLAAVLTRYVWIEDWAYLRAVSELHIVGVVVLLSSTSRVTPFILSWSLVVWLLVFQSVARRY